MPFNRERHRGEDERGSRVGRRPGTDVDGDAPDRGPEGYVSECGQQRSTADPTFCHMKVRCFACDAVVEAAETESVADAFVAHGHESHDWSSVIGVSCFVVAPPFRRHGIAAALLDRVMADGAARGASWIEGYPHHEPAEGDGGRFRGPPSMYLARGFEAVAVREHDTVLRRRLPDAGGTADA